MIEAEVYTNGQRRGVATAETKEDIEEFVTKVCNKYGLSRASVDVKYL